MLSETLRKEGGKGKGREGNRGKREKAEKEKEKREREKRQFWSLGKFCYSIATFHS
jgi:hypothetical protein